MVLGFHMQVRGCHACGAFQRVQGLHPLINLNLYTLHPGGVSLVFGSPTVIWQMNKTTLLHFCTGAPRIHNQNLNISLRVHRVLFMRKNQTPIPPRSGSRSRSRGLGFGYLLPLTLNPYRIPVEQLQKPC